MADVQIALRIYTKLENTFEGNSDDPLQIYYISHRRNRRWRRRKRKTKRKCKFDEDESPAEVIPPVKVVGKEDMGLFFFTQRLRTTPTLLHQVKHPSCITRLLLVVGPPCFTEGG
jgi:hypothetical protein